MHILLEIRKNYPYLNCGQPSLPLPLPPPYKQMNSENLFFNFELRLHSTEKCDILILYIDSQIILCTFRGKKVYINSMSLSYTICESLKEGGNSVQLLSNPLVSQLYIFFSWCVWQIMKKNVLWFKVFRHHLTRLILIPNLSKMLNKVYIFKYVLLCKGAFIKDVINFLRFVTPSLPLRHHFY